MASTIHQSSVEQNGAAADRELNADELLVGCDSETTPQLSVVMPTLNEEAGIRICIEWIKTAIEDLQVPTEIIISDCCEVIE
ncbi:hypothetical protein [Halorubrum kocurii]|uniref:hypothetical protein n=1 Tax=Halorubrum kocurii TaxID=478441 RepID=UPI001F4CBA9C|nr:hypothetical protein [Halorubrum kocurii]